MTEVDLNWRQSGLQNAGNEFVSRERHRQQMQAMAYGPRRPALYLTPFHGEYNPMRSVWPFADLFGPAEWAGKYGDWVWKAAFWLALYPAGLLLVILVRAMGWIV